MLFCHNLFTCSSTQSLKEYPFHVDDALTYLFLLLTNDMRRLHVMARIKFAYRAFYGLQGASLHVWGYSRLKITQCDLITAFLML